MLHIPGLLLAAAGTLLLLLVALVAVLRAQPRAVCPLCGRPHALDMHP